jgi:hypothetical protein
VDVGGGGSGVVVGGGVRVRGNVAVRTNGVGEAVAIGSRLVFVVQLLITSAMTMRPGERCFKATHRFYREALKEKHRPQAVLYP